MLGRVIQRMMGYNDNAIEYVYYLHKGSADWCLFLVSRDSPAVAKAGSKYVNGYLIYYPTGATTADGVVKWVANHNPEKFSFPGDGAPAGTEEYVYGVLHNPALFGSVDLMLYPKGNRVLWDLQSSTVIPVTTPGTAFTQAYTDSYTVYFDPHSYRVSDSIWNEVAKILGPNKTLVRGWSDRLQPGEISRQIVGNRLVIKKPDLQIQPLVMDMGSAIMTDTGDMVDTTAAIEEVTGKSIAELNSTDEGSKVVETLNAATADAIRAGAGVINATLPGGEHNDPTGSGGYVDKDFLKTAMVGGASAPKWVVPAVLGVGGFSFVAWMLKKKRGS